MNYLLLIIIGILLLIIFVLLTKADLREGRQRDVEVVVGVAAPGEAPVV